MDGTVVDDAVGTGSTSGGHGRRLPLQAYLTGLVALFVVIAGVAIAHERSRTTSEARRTAGERVQFYADLAAAELDEAVTGALAQVSGLATNPGVPALFVPGASSEGCTLQFGGTGPFVSGRLDVVDAAGTTRCSSEEIPAPGTQAGSEWLDVDATGPVVVGPVDDPLTGEPALVVATAVERAGVVAVFLHLDGVVEELAMDFGGPLGSSFAITPTAADAPSEDGRIARSSDVEAVHWTVTASIDSSTATAEVDDVQRREILFLAAALLVLVLATHLVYRSVARPIERLSRSVRAARAGDLSTDTVELVRSGPAEVVSLSRDFAGLSEEVGVELGRRREAEEEARRAAESYRLLFDTNPQAMWVQDRDTGALLEVNDATVDMLGWSRDDLLRMTASELHAGDDTPEFAAELVGDRRLVRSGPWHLGRRDEGVVECEITSDVLELRGRHVRLVVAEDVTTELRTQRLLQQAERMESLGQLAGGIAHDFNNLLAVMINYADFAAEEVAKAAEREPTRWSQVQHDVEQVGVAGRKAAALTAELLAFARGDRGEAGPVDLSAVAGGLENLLRRTLGEHIDLELSLEPHLAAIDADRTQIEQVIVNLAVNARDAMPDGGKLAIETANVEVDEHQAEERPELAPGDYVRLRVSDTGAGMSPEIRERAFEPFFTTKERGSGTGLGLATVYGIVSRAGGVIRIYSEPGLGTSLSALFPVARSAAAPDEPAVVGSRSVSGTETILVVEDDEDLRVLAERILRREGYQVLVAASGDEALEIAAARRGGIDLVLTDVVMPGMLGNDLADRLREVQPDLRVLLMSGYAPPVLVSGGNIAATTPVLDKPFSAGPLLRKVREALDS